jgi:Holliday junction DNA helicase RuvA
MFLKLISVSGIGPKSALSILAAGKVKEIAKAIEDRNDAYLRKFPGIGSKASMQIILDLKGKLVFEEDMVPVNSKSSDVEQALMSLGYSKKEVEKVLSKLDMSLDEGQLIKLALQKMIK